MPNLFSCLKSKKHISNHDGKYSNAEAAPMGTQNPSFSAAEEEDSILPIKVKGVDVKVSDTSESESDSSNDKAGVETKSSGESIMTVHSVSHTPSFAEHVVAHRGFHSKAERADRPLENTLAAFEYAWRNGVDMCECDVQLTKDNVLVINHDASALRLACSPGDENAHTDIDELTWKEVQEIELKDGSSVPTLRQVLEAANRIDVDARLVVEVKAGDAQEEASLRTTQVLFDLLHTNPDLCKRVAVVMSFDIHVVKRFAFLTHKEKCKMHPKVMLLTSNPDTSKAKDWVTRLDYATLATDKKYRKALLGVADTHGKVSLDGCYIRFRIEMLDGGKGEELFRLACKMCALGVWMDGTDPDTMDNTAKLIECGAMFVNSDFTRMRQF